MSCQYYRDCRSCGAGCSCKSAHLNNYDMQAMKYYRASCDSKKMYDARKVGNRIIYTVQGVLLPGESMTNRQANGRPVPPNLSNGSRIRFQK